MTRPPRKSLEDIIETINNEQSLLGGCKKAGISNQTFYERVKKSGFELVKKIQYRLEKKPDHEA
jgi:hypothetical protein